MGILRLAAQIQPRTSEAKMNRKIEAVEAAGL